MNIRVGRGMRSRCAPKHRRLLVETLELRALLAVTSGSDSSDYSPSDILVRFRTDVVPANALALPRDASGESRPRGDRNIFVTTWVSLAQGILLD